VLRIARGAAVECLDFGLVSKVDELYRRMEVNLRPDEIPGSRFIEAASLARELGAAPQDIVARLECAASVLRDAREPIFSTLFDMASDGRFSYAFGVKADVSEISNLNFRIVDELIGKFDNTFVDLFTIACLRTRDVLPPRGFFKPREETAS